MIAKDLMIAIFLAERHFAEQARRSLLAAGDGLHHGHPQNQALRRGQRRPAALGLRGPAAQTCQRRRLQGPETALRGIRSLLWRKFPWN